MTDISRDRARNDSPAWQATATDYQANAAFVSAHGGPLIEMLNAVPGELVLDLGCGDGTLAAGLVAAGVSVVAVDASRSMVTAAVGRGVKAQVDEATTLTTVDDGSIDAVFSNAVLHWVRPAAQAAQAMHRVLRPGGRLALEFGGHGNVAAIRVALQAALDLAALPDVHGPDWFFPTPAEYTAILSTAGFAVVQAELIPRPTSVPAGLGAWLDTFVGSVADQIGEAAWTQVRADTVRLLTPVLQDSHGSWTADYQRLRIAARKL